MKISDLKSIYIFENIDDRILEKICKLDIEKANLMPEDLVVCEGEEVDKLIIIKSGLLKQAKYLEDGSEKTVAYYYENEVYPLHLLYAGIEFWPYDIYAEFESEIFYIPWDELKEIIDSEKSLVNNILFFTAYCTCHTKIILNATRYKKVQERIAYWLTMKKYIGYNKVPITQKMLSDTLRVTRPSLNQELKKLESLGVINIEMNNIEVIDEEYLKEIIENV